MLDTLTFWFQEHGPKNWFKKDAAFDAKIQQRFGTLVERAIAGELQASNADERLALILILDQFPRNIFRGSAKSFSGDERAVALTNSCIRSGDLDADPSTDRRQFILMPLMHSESLDVHTRAIPLFETYTSANVQDFAEKHRVIIERFGRYPHRNDVLSRVSTPEEIDFLSMPGSSF